MWWAHVNDVMYHNPLDHSKARVLVLVGSPWVSREAMSPPLDISTREDLDRLVQKNEKAIVLYSSAQDSPGHAGEDEGEKHVTHQSLAALVDLLVNLTKTAALGHFNHLGYPSLVKWTGGSGSREDEAVSTYIVFFRGGKQVRLGDMLLIFDSRSSSFQLI